MKSKKNKLYEVEIKSMALINEGKKSLITYFQGGTKKRIVSNVQKIFPQYTKMEDKPVVNITSITFKEYEERKSGGQIKQKVEMIQTKGDIL
jgi:hypothetical protein